MDKSILKKIEKGKVCAIIPARAGSKGIRDKNIKQLCGFPMMAYSIVAARLTKNIDRVIVSTDSKMYAQIAQEYGAEVPFLRPKELSGDNSTDLEFLQHAITWLSENEGSVPEYFVHLRITCPIRKPEVIENAITIIKEHPEATCLLSACVPHGVVTPYKWLIKDGEDYFRSIFFDNNDDGNLPRQAYPPAYMRSIYVDILKTEQLVTNQQLFGKKILAFETDETIDIDELKDCNAAKTYLEKEKIQIYNYLREYYSMKEGEGSDVV